MWLWQPGSEAAGHSCCPNVAVADCQMQGVTAVSAQQDDYYHHDILTTGVHVLMNFIIHNLL